VRSKTILIQSEQQTSSSADFRIPRDEVLEIVACIMEHLTAILEGCDYTITGG
jgi:hypothetical protein